MRVMRSLCLPVLAVALVAVGPDVQLTSAETVAINEIDYQNPGTDSTEWIELVGKAGTDLTGWTIELYSLCSSGCTVPTGSHYATITLQGEIPNDFNSCCGGQGGFYVFGAFDAATTNAFPGQLDFTPAGWTTNEIQNGPNDGIVLYNAQHELVDAVVYDADSGGGAAVEAYDSAGTAGDVSTYSSLGRRGYDYGSPMYVFDAPNAVCQAVNICDSHNNAAGIVGCAGTETSTSSEWYWSGTSSYGAGRGITPGGFNGASYGTSGMQDEMTVNIVPEPGTFALLLVGGLALIGKSMARRRRDA